MANADASDHSPFAEWEGFVHRHAGHPFLQQDPLYAMSETLIGAIKQEAPTFFGEDQERFESDLAKTASFGFFHRRVLGLTAGHQPTDAEGGVSFMDRHGRLVKAIDEMMAEELRRQGLTKGEIDKHLQQGADARKMIDDRKEAYAGWLISNSRFHHEVGELRASWEPLVRELGRLPVYPRWPLHDDLLGTEVPGGFGRDCYNFYRRWGLDRMVTWDWPIPMEPDFSVGMIRDLHLLSDAGVVFFAPWYLLRGERLDLQAVVQQARNTCEAEHLTDWLHKQSSHQGEGLGDVRFQHMRMIYRFHELILMRRYGPACRGHVQRLDRALASVIKRDEDTVKRLRLELNRGLHGTCSSIQDESTTAIPGS